MKNKERVLCALSGGMDSVCMTHYLCSLGSFIVSAAHFSHGIRPGDAQKERELCQRLCDDLSIELFCGEGDAPGYSRENGVGLEEAARILRYDFLKKTARSVGADRIALAHHARDNAETFLFNLVRGTGSLGAGMSRDDGLLLRPLLDWTREKIESYVLSNGLEYAVDPTNEIPASSRNILRLEVLPLLEKVHPGAERAVERAAVAIRADGEYLDHLARREAQNARFFENGCVIRTEWFLQLPRPVAGRVLRHLFSRCGGSLRDLSMEHFEAFSALCASSSPSSSLSLPCGFTAYREYGDAVMERLCDLPPLPETPLKDGLNRWGEWEITLTREPDRGAVPAPAGELTVRPRAPGDRIGGKSLKELMIDKKIPRRRRDGIPVFCADGVPFWACVEGLRFDKNAAERYIITEYTGGKDASGR